MIKEILQNRLIVKLVYLSLELLFNIIFYFIPKESLNIRLNLHCLTKHTFGDGKHLPQGPTACMQQIMLSA